MFDDLEIIMRNFESIPGISIKKVAPNRTFDFGFFNEADGSGLEIRNPSSFAKGQYSAGSRNNQESPNDLIATG